VHTPQPMEARPKLFKYDRNYILKDAQSHYKPRLLKYMVEKVKKYYLGNYNPLGIEDDAVLKIKHSRKYCLQHFDELYWHMAAVYRYQNTENQLEILFDGRSHFEKFGEEWAQVFSGWINEFCKKESFIKAVLEAAIFYANDRKGYLAFNRLKIFLVTYFEIKIYKQKGLVVMKVA
jgi:hypothetical protein